MGKRKVGALEKIDADLANLQFKIRRDSSSYKEDFQKQYYQYETFRELFLQAPSSADDAGIVSLRELIDFVAHVADCYPEITRNFPQDLIGLLTLHHAELQHELRDKVVGSLSLLRNKDVIDSSTLLQTLFPILISTESKSLRALLFRRIVNTIRSANSKSTNHRLNRTIQTLLHNLITADPSSPKGVWAVRITRELWRRRVWSDAGAVEIMKEASLADNEKLIVGGSRFFLGGDQDREDAALEDSDEDEGIDLSKIRHQMNKNKKSNKKENELKKAAATVRRKERRKNQPHPLNFSALHLLRDPQGFAEKLFAKHLQQMKIRLNLSQKLVILQLVSRLIGLHKLIIISFYPYIQRYLTPRQPDVTSFLASLAQGTHNLVPPDLLEPLVLKIANEFVSEAVASEVAAAGLNAIREICVRQPLAMDETLLQDLVMYRKSKDKSVMMAAKGLLGLYREVGAQLLNKKDRGRVAALGLRKGERQALRYGEQAGGGIEGIELLEKWKEEERVRRRQENGDPAYGQQGMDENGNNFVDRADEDEFNSEDWEVGDGDGSDGSGGWIDVSSDEETVTKPKKGSFSRDAIEESNGTVDRTGYESESLEPSSKRTRLNVDEGQSNDEDENQDEDGDLDEDDVEEEEEEAEEEQDIQNDDADSNEHDESSIENEYKLELKSPGAPAPAPAPAPASAPASASASASENARTNPIPDNTQHQSLAATRILTPADLSKLNELKAQASIEAMLPFAARRRMQLNNKNDTNTNDNNSNNNTTTTFTSSSNSRIMNTATYDDPGVTAAKIQAPSFARPTKEQKLLLAGKTERRDMRNGTNGAGAGETNTREKRQRDRQQHMSRAARRAERKREAGKSSTNKEKERKKNVLMTLGKARGKMKGRGRRGGGGGSNNSSGSLVQKGKQLKGMMAGKGGKGGRKKR